MHLTPREYKPKPSILTGFTLVGRIIKIREGAIQLQRHGTKYKFWVDLAEPDNRLKEGSLIECDLNISSYVDRNHLVYRYKLRYTKSREIPSDMGDNISTFWGGLDTYEVRDVTGTQIPNLYIMQIEKPNTKESFMVTYTSEDEPKLGLHKIDLELESVASVLGTDGKIYEDSHPHRIVKNGETRTIRLFTYFPALKIKSIYNLDSHGEGGDTKSI